ncbi:MAG: hypothetical protein HY513_00775 [Candidatus Aenigmarchaeota archaeon]|nr:hypothetical protein [Candidatus Aenigmarchaeota archaeon]
MDRIDDLEQSLITLAKFVKDETCKLKTENENIKSSFSSPSRSPSGKVIELEAKINDVQKRMAALMLKSNDQKPLDYSAKISSLESRVEDLQNNAYSIKSEHTWEEKFAVLEQKIEAESVQASGALESQISALASEIQKVKQQMEEAGSKQDDAGAKYYMEKLSEQMSVLENELQNKVENARSVLDDEFKNRLDGLKMVLEEEAKRVAQEKTKEASLAREMSEIREESFAEEAYLDRKLQDAAAKIEKSLDSADFDKRVDKKLEEMNEQISLKMHALETLENKMNQVLQEKMAKVEQDERNQGSDYDKNLSTKMEELEEKITLKLHALESLENKMNEMINRKVNMVEEDESLGVASADKKIQDLHMTVAEMQKDLSQIKSGDVLEEKAFRKDLDALKGRVKFFDDHIKTIAMKHMTKQLEEFARYLDGKIPEVVTIEEFQRHMDMLNRKISAIEAPDTAQIMQRIGAMEKEIRDVLAGLKDVYYQMPKFVE